MKIPHKINGWAPDRTDPEWADRVEREAERTTNAREQAYLKAQARLARAVEKAEYAERVNEASRQTRRIGRLWEEVELRRRELMQFQGISQESPAGSQNRGQGGFRGVATGGTL